jgi:hypothetical protein
MVNLGFSPRSVVGSLGTISVSLPTTDSDLALA